MSVTERMGDAIKPEEHCKFFTSLIIEFGGMRGAADAIGVSYQAIHNWRSRGVPLAKVKLIEQLSEGRVHRGMLNG